MAAQQGKHKRNRKGGEWEGKSEGRSIRGICLNLINSAAPAEALRLALQLLTPLFAATAFTQFAAGERGGAGCGESGSRREGLAESNAAQTQKANAKIKHAHGLKHMTPKRVKGKGRGERGVETRATRR